MTRPSASSLGISGWIESNKSMAAPSSWPAILILASISRWRSHSAKTGVALDDATAPVDVAAKTAAAPVSIRRRSILGMVVLFGESAIAASNQVAAVRAGRKSLSSFRLAIVLNQKYAAVNI